MVDLPEGGCVMGEMASPYAAMQVAALLEKAELYAASGRMTDARSAYLAAIELDSGFAARNAYGCFLTAVQQYREAIEQFTALLDAARDRADRDLAGVANHNLAVIYRELGEFDLAAHFQRAAFAAQESFDSCDLFAMANESLLQGDIALAEKLVRATIALDSEADSDDSHAAALGTLGLIAEQRGDLRRGIGYLSEAFRRHRRRRDRRGMGTDLVHLSRVYQAAGRDSSAKRCLQRAAWCFERAHAPRFARLAERMLDEALQS